MRKIVLLPFLFICFQALSQFPAESDPHRGLYVDRFAKKLQGTSVYDPNFSILAADENRDGIFEKEDMLLQYCSENHITDIELYDLEKILGGTLSAWNENAKMYESLEKHLCRFMQKARDQFCITEIGAAGGAAYVFDSVAAFNERYPITEPYRLRQDQRTSPYFDPTLNIVEQNIPLTDPSSKKAELLKYCLRTADFNSCNQCGAHFDNMNIEMEFWFSCANDLPGFESLLFAMNSIKQMYNTNHPNHSLKTEAYLAFLTSCPNYIDVINFMDGCNNCAPCSACTNPHPRLLDRVLYSQLTGNGNFYDYSVQNLFEQPQTGDSTDYHSIQYAECTNTGGSVDYLGAWFEQSPWYNIFSAEEFYYDGYRNNGGATFWSPESNNLQPGGTTWFASSHMVGHLDNPNIIQNSGPYCTPDSELIEFYYVGPDDPGMDYEFWVTNDVTGDTVYPRAGGVISNTSTTYIPSTSTLPRHRSIDFTDTLIFPALYLSAGKYTSHINLYYDHHSGCSYSSEYPIQIKNLPLLDLVGASVFCHGEYTYLKANYGSTFQWYRDSLPLFLANAQFFRVTEDGNYFCYVTGGGTCSGYSDTIHIHVLPLPSIFVNAFCNGNGTVTLKSNLENPNPTSLNIHGDGGLLFQWNTGAVTDQLTVTPGTSRTSYRLTVTDPYSGCSTYRDISVPPVPLNSYTPSVVVQATPTSPCSHDGILRAGILPDPGGTVSFLWSNGETTRNLYSVAPGLYSVTETVWGGACSYYASINLGTLPPDSPLVNEVITSASCHNIRDGSIQLTLTGGHPPFNFKWREIPDDTLHDPTSQNQSNLFPGMYHLSIFDSSGCEFTKSFFVSSSNGSITINSGTVNAVTICAGDHSGSATVIASGGNSPYAYQWNDSALTIGQTASSLYAGTYQVTVTDVNGCTGIQLVSVPTTVLQLTASLLDSSITVLNCDSSNNGSLIIDVCGGTLPYAFNGIWVFDSLAHIENLESGIYPFVMTDANGCTLADTFLITAPSPVIAVSSITHTSCIGCPDGSILTVFSGGTPPYSVIWTPMNGNLNGNNIENLTAGIYQVCISDSFNCSICFTDTVLDDPLFNEEFSGREIKIYPNPFSQTATLYLKSLSEECTFVIYDLTGRVLFELKPIKTETIIDRKNLSSGIYYFELTEKNLLSKKGKLILY